MHLASGPNTAVQSAWLVQGPPTAWAQKPSPSIVLTQLQVLALLQKIECPVAHLAAHRHPLEAVGETTVPPFLRHLRLKLTRASASRGNRGGTTAPRSAPPASFSALPLEMVPLSSLLARSSKNCSLASRDIGYILPQRSGVISPA